MGARESTRNVHSRRISFGTAKLHGDDRRTNLTITRDLDSYDFPNETGAEVRVELIEIDGEPNRLEVTPIDGGE